MTRTGKLLIAVMAPPLKLQAFTSTWPAVATRLGYITIPFWIAARVVTIGESPTAALPTLNVTCVHRPLGIPLSEMLPLVAAPARSEVVSDSLATWVVPTAFAASSDAPTEPDARSLEPSE